MTRRNEQISVCTMTVSSNNFSCSNKLVDDISDMLASSPPSVAIKRKGKGKDRRKLQKRRDLLVEEDEEETASSKKAQKKLCMLMCV